MSKKNKRGIFGKIFKFFFFIALFFVILGLVVGIATFVAISRNFPSINTQNLDALLEETSFIYDDSNNITEKIQSNIYRTIVPIEDIPANVQKAFIAIEDERFYEHNGVDIKRVFGAALHDIKAGALEQGASTITMQLSKNLFTSTEKSALRKITDAVYAIEIEKNINKSQVLYAYLNTVFLGSNVNGVQAASKSYFNKDIIDVNLAEAAVIAGITKYPTKYLPYKLLDITLADDFENLQIKMYPPSEKYTPTQNDLEIYDKLRNIGKIDQYEYILLKNGSIVVAKAQLNEQAINRQKVILKKMLDLGFIDSTQYNDALNTPLVINFPSRNNSGMSSYFNDKVKQEVIKILVEQGNSKEHAEELLKFGGLKIYTTLDTKLQKILESEFNNSANFPNSFYDKDGVIQPQAAMVLIDQKTGYVKALMGGRGQAGSYIFDRADNPRQPGSAIKPLAVYLLALKDGQTPNTIIEDNPRQDSSSPTGYWPKNINDVYYGPSTMKKMIEVSSNVAAVKTLESLGRTRIEAISRSLNFIEQMGFEHIVRSSDNPANNDENLAMALGGLTKGVTPIEMASAYSGLANLGKQNKVTFITKIEDTSGNIIYQYSPSYFEMVDEINAYKMTDMLMGVISSGSGKTAKLDNMPSAGKTGTTDDRKDVYFVGYTPYYTASVWIGADSPVELSSYNSSHPAKIWANVMNKINATSSLSYKEFDAPNGALKIEDESSEQKEQEDTVNEEETRIVDPNESQMIDEQLFEEYNKNTTVNNQPAQVQPQNLQQTQQNTQSEQIQQPNQPQQNQPTQPEQVQNQPTDVQTPTNDTAPTTIHEDTNNTENISAPSDTPIF